ncbi:MAG: PAS domain S-box-containing protein [Glaciecola sp.]|jgi:PAS domain S-box-containing protein
MIRQSITSNANKSIAKRLFILPAIILLIGLGLSINAEITQRSEDSKKVDLALKAAVEKFELKVTERLTFYSYGLRSIDSLISAVGKENFDYQVMQSFARSRDFQTEFPGVRGFGVIQNIDADELDSFIAKNREMRPDGAFNVKHLNEEPERLFIIRDILPESKNASAIGLNIGSEQSRRAAAIESASRSEITITSPITLVQADQSIKQGFLILLAYSESEAVAPTLENTWGWSYAPIVIDEVIDSIDTIDDNLILSISNRTAAGDSLFYQSEVIRRQTGSYNYHIDVPVFGKNWRFEAHTSPAFVNSIKQPPYGTFLKFIILTFLVAITLFTILLVILKRFDSKIHVAELAIAKEQALTETNRRLESLVKSRTTEIEKSASFQKAILQSSTYAIIATDVDGLITMFNPAAENLLGYKASDLIGKETPRKFHVDDEMVKRAEELSKEMHEKIEPGFDVFTYKANLFGKEESTWTYVHRNGKHIRVKLSVSGLYDEHQNIIGYLGIAYDLTEQLAYEQIIKEEKVKAEQATLAKSQFLANMSHEIRTPLNGVQGALQILEGKTLNAELASIVNIALRSMKSLSLLVNDILDISRVEAGKIHLSTHSFRLDELLSALHQEFDHSAESKGIQLNLENHLQHTSWVGDDLRIKQILTNLISNAIKFTEQGSVTIIVEEDNSRGLKFSVIDTGIGMEKSGLEVLFNRFEQADKSITRKFGGSGLGMAISKSLIDLMGGTIEVKSELNHGTTFEIFLPLEPVDDSASSDIELVETTADLSKFSILVAEDNEINQIIIETILADVGAQIVIVDNGQKAIDSATETSFDLILLDIQMPVLDGMQACIAIKKLSPETPIIALTANVFAEDIEKYKNAGFDSFMGKPYEKDEIIKLVKAYLLKQDLNSESFKNLTFF